MRVSHPRSPPFKICGHYLQQLITEVTGILKPRLNTKLTLYILLEVHANLIIILTKEFASIHFPTPPESVQKHRYRWSESPQVIATPVEKSTPVRPTS
jgi:hypothetical protein